MKSFMYAAKAIFVTLLFCCSGLAYADGACPPEGTGTAECPQNVDTVEVTTGREGGGGGGEEGGCGSSCSTDTGGIGGGSGTGQPAYNQNTFKTDRRFCIRSGETCDNWFLRAVDLCISSFPVGSSLTCQREAIPLSSSCDPLRVSNTC
jgi:hypothetical protein